MAGQETFARLEYDLEYHIGLESAPWDADLSSAAWLRIGETNRNLLTSAFANAHSRGTFQFAKKGIGPIRHAIRGAGKQFPIVGQINTGTRGGTALLGPFGRPQVLPNTVESPDDTSEIGGNCLRFTRLDGENGGSVFNIQNHGTTFGFGVEVRGRWYGYDPSGEGPNGAGSLPNPAGTKTPYGISIEGRNQPSTGRHIFFGVTVSECNYGIAGRDTPEATHADNVDIYSLIFWNCGSAIRLENQQAVEWNIHNAEIYNVGGAGLIDPCIVADVVKGGDLTFSGRLGVHAKRAIILKTNFQNYPSNYGPTVVQNFKWDQGTPEASNYLTLVHIDGTVTPGADMSGWKYFTRMTGGLANSVSPIWDTDRLVVIEDSAVFPAGVPVPRECLLFDVANLPLDGTPQFESIGSWLRPVSP